MRTIESIIDVIISIHEDYGTKASHRQRSIDYLYHFVDKDIIKQLITCDNKLVKQAAEDTLNLIAAQGRVQVI